MVEKGFVRVCVCVCVVSVAQHNWTTKKEIGGEEEKKNGRENYDGESEIQRGNRKGGLWPFGHCGDVEEKGAIAFLLARKRAFSFFSAFC